MPLKHSVEEVVLKNGARGLLISVPDTTSVHYDIQFRAGNYYAKRREISQVAHILEHMSFGPNARFDSVESFSQEFTRNGAYSNASTDSDDLIYTAAAAIMEWDRILELQQLAITQPKYPQALLDTEKGNVREEIIGYSNDYARILWQRMMRQSGLNRWLDSEELLTIDTVTLADINEHYKRTHTLKNMHFIIAGDLQTHAAEIIDRLEHWQLPTGEPLPMTKETVKAGGMVHLARKDLSNLNFTLLFSLNRTLNRRELRAMNVLTHILTDTFHSRIWGTARARGICYGMGSWGSESSSGVSEFGLGGQVSFDNADELFRLMIEQLKIVSTVGVTEKELDEAKQYRLGVLQMGLDTVSSLVSWYEDIYFDNGKIDHVDAFPALIQGTTVTEIRDLAKEFLDAKLWVFGGVGNITKKALQKHYDLFAKELIEG